MKSLIKKADKLFYLFIIIFISMATLSLQHFRLDKKNHHPRQPSPRHLNLKSLNEGKPFHFKGLKYAPDQILVKFKPSLTEQMIEAEIAAYQTKKIRLIPRIHVYQLQIPENLTVEEMLSLIRQNPDVDYAEPNYRAYIAVTPDDVYFKWQYALYNSGQEIGPPGSPRGTAGADIKAPSAWEETKGDEKVVIAVIDTGVDFKHPDLRNKILSSGPDYANDDNQAKDDNGHGTFVAGIAAAESNNSEGIAGVAWNCKIIPIKAMDEEGSGYYSWIIQAIIWATDHEADVINLSLGGEEPAQSLKDAVRYASENNVVVASAAGNDGASVLYPAAYDEYCLAVAATDYDDNWPSWSNSGSEVDVAAPGERIVGPVPTWYWGPGSFPYGYGSGTSAATPHAAGLAALIKSIKPWLTASEIINIICYSADDVNSSQFPGKDKFIGYGRINMEKALVPIKITSSQ